MYKNKNRYFWLFLALLLLAPVVSIYAEGSKDLYPNGASGRRAYLTSYYQSYAGSLPFQSYGTHYVYAKAGETIALASSAWTGNAKIKLFGPNGSEITLSTSNNAGRISTRDGELAGPKLTSADNTANRYLPIYYTVPIGGEGIYKVEFHSKTTDEMISTTGFVNTKAGEQWNSWNTGNTKSTHIGAWDVSVINPAKNAYIKGRVYASVLNMRIEGSSDASDGFYGKMYVLTKDGYTYLVNNNGNNGILFSFFVNNNGFVKGKQRNGTIDYTPLYKSLVTVAEASSDNKIWDPTGPDNPQNITHKMFYTLPSNDLPLDIQVAGAVPGGSTWLRNTVVEPKVEQVKILGKDDTEGQISTKGGYIQFNASNQGTYTITIKSSTNPAGFVTRELIGTAVAGLNKVYFDGKGGDGKSLPAGNVPATVTVKLQGAEVHFPYFDVENNINGIKLELLDHEDLTKVKSDIVYWNDVDIPTDRVRGSLSNPINNSQLSPVMGGVSSKGISSSTNGHKWGGSATTGTFGDTRSMDTWTFIQGEEKTVDTDIHLKVADLKITQVTSNKPKVIIGEEVVYTVKVKNGEQGDGNSDVTEAKFTFALPEGFGNGSVSPVFVGNNCGSESAGGTITYDPSTRTYTSFLDLPNGCEVTYTFTAKVVSGVAGSKSAEATILRPQDVTDPDATNRSDPENELAPATVYPNPDVDAFYVPPFDAHYECLNRDKTAFPPGTHCNNMMSTDIALVANYWHGTLSNEWKNSENWTAKFVPGEGADVIFATEANNGTSGDGNGAGPAIRDLYLDNIEQSGSGGRIIGNLVNNSTVDLVITTGNKLLIQGEVVDNVPGNGTIVVKSTNIPVNAGDPIVNEPTGTLIVDKSKNPNGVEAIVEFYNRAYDCADCGFYTRSWQYFGIPVESSQFPAGDVTGNETVNIWTEPYNGDKWRPVPVGTELKAFKGYQITNDIKVKPEGVYRFNGKIALDDAKVDLTKTANVNYPGANLVANSFTAAIPIKEEAFTFPANVNKTLYLFNTGTRDQWRKLNGTLHNVEGYRSGQYLAVPLNLGGTAHFPDRIPSMHSFMVLFESTAGATPENNSPKLEIKYTGLVKNTEVDLGDGSTKIVTRSAGSSASSIPSLVMDVIGAQSADRVWIFAKEGTSYGFDNGWDGRKMSESGITQLYVADDTGKENLQVATVPGLDNVTLGFVADVEGKYTIEFALSDHWNNREVYLLDLATNTQTRVTNNGSYSFSAKKGESGTRFRLSATGGIPGENVVAKIIVTPTSDGRIAVSNQGDDGCTVYVSSKGGKLLQKLEVFAGEEQIIGNISSGTYVVRLQNAEVSDTRKVIVE